MYRDSFKQDAKDFCRTGDHAKHRGIRTVINGGLDLYSSPTGTYILKPIGSRWWFNWKGKPIYDYTKVDMYLENGMFDDVNIQDFITHNEDMKLECFRTAFIILNDLEASPDDGTYTARMYDRVGFIITGNQVIKFDVNYYGERFDGLEFYVYDTWDSYRILDDIFEELRDALEELGNEDEEIRQLISNLEKKHNSDINKILKYYEQTDEGLKPVIETFKIIYNTEYISNVKHVVRVEPLGGVVHLDLRMKMLKDVPAGSYLCMAKIPKNFNPTLSAPLSWTVRDETFTDTTPEWGTPAIMPQLIDGYGVMSYRSDESQELPSVYIHNKDLIPARYYLYLSGTYYLPSSVMGIVGRDKTIVEEDGFKFKENLLYVD